MTTSPYERILCTALDAPPLADPSAERLLALLVTCAEVFAEACRADPGHERDGSRSASLLCAIGIGADEASGFLRAIDEGLVVLHPDGNFLVPGARACSQNLHLVGREGDGVKLHNEVLIHVAAYAELVLDHGWPRDRLVFDPFFANDALDLWGYSNGPTAGTWRDGDIVFAAEAKARVKGADGLERLVQAFERLSDDPAAVVAQGPRRKWDEIVRLTDEHRIELLLVADGARWWYSAERRGDSVDLQRIR